MCESAPRVRLRRYLTGLVVVAVSVLASGASSTAAFAQDGSGQGTQSEFAAPAPVPAHWFVGAYYRHAWVPKLFLKPFFERGASVSNDGFGLVVSRSTASGVSAQ